MNRQPDPMQTPNSVDQVQTSPAPTEEATVSASQGAGGLLQRLFDRAFLRWTRDESDEETLDWLVDADSHTH